jgi:DNA-binding Xre family transcriptional regulator
MKSERCRQHGPPKRGYLVADIPGLGVHIKTLKHRLADRDINKSDLAKLTGLTRATIAKLLDGKKGMKLETIHKVATVLDFKLVLDLQDLEKPNAG